jgi:predicted nucleotidyltransferase component of viral defense system
MLDAIRRMLKGYDSDSEARAVQALREILQEITLLGLWRSKFFEHGAFYGGTALRILYGLDRYSEDLDFSLLVPDKNFDLNRYMPAIEKELIGFGFAVRAEVQQKRVITPIQSAFIKTDTIQSLLTISTDKTITRTIPPGRLLKIKLEIDTDPPPGFDVEAKYLLKPIPFAVRTYVLPDLFAGKIHALLCRKWRDRVKGRDWYDLVWYLTHYPELHLTHLEQRMRQSGHWQKEFSLDKVALYKLLDQAIEQLNINQARQDVSPFLKDPGIIEVWSKDFFRSVIGRICLV